MDNGYIHFFAWNIVHEFLGFFLEIMLDHSFLSVNNQFFWHNFVLLKLRQQCYFSISGSGCSFQFLIAALQTTTMVFIPVCMCNTIPWLHTYVSLYWYTLPESFPCSRATSPETHEAKCTPQLPWRVAYEPQSRPLASWNRKTVQPLSRIVWLLCAVMSRMVTRSPCDLLIFSFSPQIWASFQVLYLKRQYSSSGCYNTFQKGKEEILQTRDSVNP